MIGARNRDVSRRKALRRRRISRYDYSYRREGKDYYDNLHQYSKNKIHCSCPACSAKTRNKGRRDRKNYDRPINYKAADMRRVITMDYDEEETLGVQRPKRPNKD